MGEKAVERLRHEWALEKFRVRWTRAIDSEVGFWFGRLSPDPEINERTDSRERLREWLLSGAAPWAYDDMCVYLEKSGSRGNRTSLHILNTGSGPFTPKELVCENMSYEGEKSLIPRTSPLRFAGGRAGGEDADLPLCSGGVEEGHGGGGTPATTKCRKDDGFFTGDLFDGLAPPVADAGKAAAPSAGWMSSFWASMGSEEGSTTNATSDGAAVEDHQAKEATAVEAEDTEVPAPSDETETGLSSTKTIDLRVPITSADGLGKYYLQLYDGFDMYDRTSCWSHHNMSPPTNLPVQCHVEELSRCFPVNHFDELLHVTRPKGLVLLRHAQNEGVPGEFRVGLHQWAFDVAVKEYVTRPVVGFTSPQRVGRGHFIIWNPELRLDVTEYLLKQNLVSEIVADLVPHPSGNAAPDEKFVWVDIVK
eukprot:g9186.t1